MNYTRQPWRLLITPPSRGDWNMAIDEAILEGVGEHKSPPCLRLYAWQPPCLSIGYAQPKSDIDFPLLHAFGWDWVRRLTGGRAILHTDELTYSVIAPTADPRVAGGVLESYQRLSAALLAALHTLNLNAQSHPDRISTTNQANGAVCFEVPSNYEIVIQAKKIIGSAQARRKNSVLQHGTFPLWGDLTRITEVLSFEDEQSRHRAATRLLSHATTAETILGTRLTWEEAAQAFIHGFHSELNLEFIPIDLSPEEINRAEVLMHEKYAHPSWLERI